MKKIGRGIIVLLAAAMLFAFAACAPAEPGPIGPTGAKRGKVTIAMSIGADELEALKAVIAAYNEINPLVDVNVVTKDYDSYREWLSQQLNGGTENMSADIVQNNTVSEYHRTDYFVDYSSYLVQKNSYAEDQIWADTMNPAAYRVNGSDKEVFSLNFDSTQMMFFYNKDIFRAAGLTVDGSTTGEPLIPEDWDEMVEFSKKISETKNAATGTNYTAITLPGDHESFWNLNMGWLIRIYSDQYFRDVEETVHAKKGDYLYDAEIDDEWEFKPNPSDWAGLSETEAFNAAITNDAPENYTANPLRLLKLLQDDEVGPNTPRYQDMLTNFKKLIPTYCQSSFLSDSFGVAQSGFWNESCAITYSDANFFKNYYQNESEIDMGYFFAPPMKHAGVSGGAPAVDVTRALGGPQGFYGVINKSKAQNDLTMDFMMFWASKQGQQASVDKLEEIQWYVTGTPFVYGVEVPESVNPAGNIPFMGECDLDPINVVARGLEGEGESVRAYQVNMQQLFDGKITIQKYGELMQKKLKDQLPAYLAMKGFRQDALEDVSAYPFDA